jgi:UDPglucose 6-dehydrogenase
VSAACLASLGHVVVGVDEDQDNLARLLSGRAPVYEPGLNGLLCRQIAEGRLSFTTDVGDAVGRSDVVVIAYDTRISETDEVDVTLVERVIEQVIPSLTNGGALVIFSQVPVGTCQAIRERIRKIRKDITIDLAYVPENLRLGDAIETFLRPDMVVLGVEEPLTSPHVDRLLGPINAPKVQMSPSAAEMVKHAINAFLATCISFANELALLCQAIGADATQVSAALRMDRRIGARAPLSPGAAFAGGTLARDVTVLRKVAADAGISAFVLDAVVQANDRQRLLPVRWLNEIFGELNGLSVGMLGLTYKAGTSTMRRSAGLDLIRALVERGVAVAASDPKADLSEVRDLPPFYFSRDPYDVVAGKDALLIMTAWPEFVNLDYRRIRALMRHAVVVDLPNLLDPRSLQELGFSYIGVGRGFASPSGLKGYIAGSRSAGP